MPTTSRWCGVGPDLVGIHYVSLATRYRTAACSNTLNQGLQMIQAARAYDVFFAPVFALNSNWEKEFSAPSMAHSTADAFNMVCCLDRNGKLDEVPQDKKQKAATTLLRDEFLKQDFAGPISLRASKVLGPISRSLVVEILPHMKLASRASRPGLTVGFVRSGRCTARRFHTEGEEQTCRVGCLQRSYHNTRKRAMTSRDRPSILTGVLDLLMVKPELDGVLSLNLTHGRIDIMFLPVITTEAHPAFSGARTHSNNSAEMTAMIEALSFLGPHGPVAVM